MAQFGKKKGGKPLVLPIVFVMGEEFRRKHEDAFLEWVDTHSDDRFFSFDLHACDIEDYAWLKKHIPSLTVISAGGICPFQVEGLMFGMFFHYRERHGWATLNLASTREGCYSETLYTAETPVEEFREVSSREAWTETLLELVPCLSRATFCFRFPCKKVIFVENKNDEREGQWVVDDNDSYSEYVTSWGHTLEEAWEKAFLPRENPILESLGFSTEKYKQKHEVCLSTVLPEPLETDQRTFPHPEPVFELGN